VFDVEKADRINNWRAIAHLEGPQGDKAREGLSKMPLLTDYEAGFYHAFSDLSTERQLGMAAGSIPRSAVVAYAECERLTETETVILLRVIRAMDTAWVSTTAKMQAARAG
jgi:hypothetical protein